MPKKRKRRYILFDDRAAGGDSDSAACLGFEDTIHAARRSARSFGGAAIFSFIEGPPVTKGTDYEIVDMQLVEVVNG